MDDSMFLGCLKETTHLKGAVWCPHFTTLPCPALPGRLTLYRWWMVPALSVLIDMYTWLQRNWEWKHTVVLRKRRLGFISKSENIHWEKNNKHGHEIKCGVMSSSSEIGRPWKTYTICGGQYQTGQNFQSWRESTAGQHIFIRCSLHCKSWLLLFLGPCMSWVLFKFW